MDVINPSNNYNFGITKTEIKRCCQQALDENNAENIRILNTEVCPIGDAPVGFLGRHLSLTVYMQQKTLDIETLEHKLHFFMKTAPASVPSQLQYVEDFGAFKKEIAVFNTIIPKLQNLINDKFAPKCLLLKNNFLLFENLCVKGYALAAKRNGLLNFEHLNCGLKSIANLHSASIIFETKTNKTIFELYENMLEENSYPDDSLKMRNIVFGKACDAVIELIKIIPKYKNSSNLNKILLQFRLRMREIFDLCKTSNKYKNCFSHGDLWANNVMFRYENNLPVESRMVDFQLARYAPPILDVITWLTIPSTREFREKHLNTLLNNYWKYMKDNLLKQNILLEDVISEKEYMDSIMEYKVAGLIESILFSHLTVLPTDITKEMLSDSNKFEDFIMNRRSEVCLKAYHFDEIYRERLTDMISDLIDNYIL